MSFATQSAKMHHAGRSHLTAEEKAFRIPWYNSKSWSTRREAVARRVARRNERATIRRLEREDLAKGITPSMAQARTVERIKTLHPERLSFIERVWRFFRKLLK